MINREQIIQAMYGIIKEANVFSTQDLQWCHDILRRDDAQDGVEQLTPLVNVCFDYNKNKGKLHIWEDLGKQKELAQKLGALKVLYYQQKKVLICVPQRKKHPRHDLPNLGSFLIPQHIRGDLTACYGLGYAESRQFFVDKALADKTYTHIMFIDDDILLPLNALTVLIDSGYDFIGANYVKRNPLLESTATQILPCKENVFGNFLVESKQGDLKPVPAGCLGLGATLIKTDVFRKMPRPHFYFRWEYDENGKKKKLLVGEDSVLCQDALLAGIQPMVIPGLCPVHVDVRTNRYFAPEWIVDPATRKIRKEQEDYYCKFMCDPKELIAEEIDDTFKIAGIK